MKERCRSACNVLPFKWFPRVMTTWMIEGSVDWMNAFPNKEGMSRTLSPRSIVLGTPRVNYAAVRISFGAYAMVHDGTTNTMRSRTVEAIALRPSNSNGAYFFMSPDTGRIINTGQWVELPITAEVVDRVHVMAEAEGQPDLVDGSPIFEWAPGIRIEDEDLPPPPKKKIEEIASKSSANENGPPVKEQDEETVEDPQEQDEETAKGKGGALAEVDEGAVDPPDLPQVEDEPPTVTDNEGVDKEDESPPATEEEPLTDDDQDSGDDPSPTQTEVAPTSEVQNKSRYNLRSAKPPDYEMTVGRGAGVFQFAQADIGNNKAKVLGTSIKPSCPYTNHMCTAVGVVLTQMTARKGIKLFGERAVAAMYKEFKQMHDLEVFGKLDRPLTRKEKKKALRAINLIKEKRSGDLKGGTCTDGRPQRRYIQKEECASPTVSNEVLFATLLIDALERRDVAFVDVPGAYLQANKPRHKFLIIKFEGEFVDIMLEVNPNLKDQVVVENWRKVLYLRVLKAIYGCMESALLRYNLFFSTLKKEGFVLNPYNGCLVNKMIGGTQCTIAWYVDDVEISHRSEDTVTEVIKLINSKFHGELTVSRGTKHTFLGMEITLEDDGTVSIDMKSYVDPAISQFPEKINGGCTTPATKKLFEIDKDAQKICKDRADIYHLIVAKLLWIMKRGRPDIELVVSFLCMRVSSPDVDNWGKLRQVLQYLNRTINKVRIIGASNPLGTTGYIDTSYAVHVDMQRHTDGLVTIWIGIVHGKSSKQKINSKSSTESEVVGVNEYLSYLLWLCQFLEKQGYPTPPMSLMQDNQSVFRLREDVQHQQHKAHHDQVLLRKR